MEELIARNEEAVNECIKQIDVLVDGKFVETKKDPTLKFRGSSNKRIIDVNKYKKEKIITQLAI